MSMNWDWKTSEVFWKIHEPSYTCHMKASPVQALHKFMNYVQANIHIYIIVSIVVVSMESKFPNCSIIQLN